MLRDHVQDEESEQFPQLRARIDRERLVDLARKAKRPRRSRPPARTRAPNNEVFHKLVGPGVGLVDRLRDKLSGRATG